MSFDYSVDSCLQKAMNAYFNGMSRDHADCHALVGRLIRLNEDKLLEDPNAKISLFLLPSGLVAHSALVFKNRIHDNPRHMGGEQNRSKFQYSVDIPVTKFLEMTREVAPQYEVDAIDNDLSRSGNNP